MGLQAEGQQNQAARPRFSCTPPLFSHRPPLGFHRAPRPAVVRQGGAFPWVQSPTMLCRRRGLDLRDVWPTPQLPVSKKKGLKCPIKKNSSKSFLDIKGTLHNNILMS